MSVAVVTGSSTGIGQATVVRLAQEFDTVWATLRNPDGADDLRAAVAGGGDVRLQALDVDDDASVEEAFARIAAESGPVDVLVNNAGVSGGGAIEEVPLDEFRRQMETNVFGLLRCTKAVLPAMRERGSGVIVNISSVAGRLVRGGMAAYSASKHAVEAISEALAYEVAPHGVRVVIVQPGVIATAIWGKAGPPSAETAYPLVGEQTMAYFSTMLRAPGPPQEVAEVIAAALAVDDAPLRHPVGPYAEQLLARRADLADEELLEQAGLSGDAFKASWEAHFGFSLD